jgi:hypothetical protein
MNIAIKEIVDLIKALRTDIKMEKYDYVLNLINQVENKVEQVKLAQFFQQRYLNKCLHNLKYCVDGGQNVQSILSKMKQDGF